MARTKQTDHKSSLGGDLKPKAQPAKKRRWHPGTVALRRVRHMQGSTRLAFAGMPFQRLAREIAQNHEDDVRFTKNAILALQEASEAKLVSLFRRAYGISIASKRITLKPRDLDIALYVDGTVRAYPPFAPQ